MAVIKSEIMLDHISLMDKYRSDITMLTDSNVEDELKLKIVQTLNENFEVKIILIIDYNFAFVLCNNIIKFNFPKLNFRIIQLKLNHRK